MKPFVYAVLLVLAAVATGTGAHFAWGQQSTLTLQRDAYVGMAQCFNTAVELEKKVAALEQKIKELEAKNAPDEKTSSHPPAEFGVPTGNLGR